MRTLLKLTWVEIKLFIRDPLTLVFTIAFPVINLVVLAGVFGNTPDPEIFRGVGPIDYYVPAYIGLVLAAFGIVALPVHITSYRERGILKRFRASSISVRAVLGSQLIVGSVISIASSILLIILAMLIYDVQFTQHFAIFIPAFLLGLLSMTAFGFFLGSVIPTTRAAQGIGIILLFLMMILGGAGPPPEVLPDSMGTVGSFMPVKHVITLLQDLWLGFGWNTSVSLIVAGILIVSTVISLRFFRWE